MLPWTSLTPPESISMHSFVAIGPKLGRRDELKRWMAQSLCDCLVAIRGPELLLRTSTMLIACSFRNAQTETITIEWGLPCACDEGLVYRDLL